MFMLLGADDSVKVGDPYVDGASVTAKVLEHKKGKKVPDIQEEET